MSYISEAIRLIENSQARKKNEQRGQQELQRREVEALEEIARSMRKESK